MLISLTVTHDTFAKARPVPSDQLSESERELLPTGSHYRVIAVGKVERGHIKVTLGLDTKGNQITFDGRNTVYFYVEHIKISGSTVTNSSLKTSSNGIALIKHFEGFRASAYPDPASGGDPWTIGYGTTGPHVYRWLTITEEKAEQYLAEDLATFEREVIALVEVNLSQDQFDALISFAYNLGSGALKSSTLLKLLNQGDFKGAANEFPKWCKAAGREMLGLKRRRLAEQALFNGGDWRTASI